MSSYYLRQFVFVAQVGNSGSEFYEFFSVPLYVMVRRGPSFIYPFGASAVDRAQRALHVLHARRVFVFASLSKGLLPVALVADCGAPVPAVCRFESDGVPAFAASVVARLQSVAAAAVPRWAPAGRRFVCSVASVFPQVAAPAAS